MSLSPAFRSPFTDFTGGIMSCQWNGRCAAFESRLLDCLEAYGLDKGRKKCVLLAQDYQECIIRFKEMERYTRMRKERKRQVLFGQRKEEKMYAPPPRRDSY